MCSTTHWKNISVSADTGQNEAGGGGTLHVTFRQLVCSLLPERGETATDELKSTMLVVTKLLLPSIVPSKLHPS